MEIENRSDQNYVCCIDTINQRNTNTQIHTSYRARFPHRGYTFNSVLTQLTISEKYDNFLDFCFYLFTVISADKVQLKLIINKHKQFREESLVMRRGFMEMHEDFELTIPFSCSPAWMLSS